MPTSGLRAIPRGEARAGRTGEAVQGGRHAQGVRDPRGRFRRPCRRPRRGPCRKQSDESPRRSAQAPGARRRLPGRGHHFPRPHLQPVLWRRLEPPQLVGEPPQLVGKPTARERQEQNRRGGGGQQQERNLSAGWLEESAPRVPRLVSRNRGRLGERAAAGRPGGREAAADEPSTQRGENPSEARSSRIRPFQVEQRAKVGRRREGDRGPDAQEPAAQGCHPRHRDRFRLLGPRPRGVAGWRPGRRRAGPSISRGRGDRFGRGGP